MSHAKYKVSKAQLFRVQKERRLTHVENALPYPKVPAGWCYQSLRGRKLSKCNVHKNTKLHLFSSGWLLASSAWFSITPKMKGLQNMGPFLLVCKVMLLTKSVISPNFASFIRMLELWLLNIIVTYSGIVLLREDSSEPSATVVNDAMPDTDSGLVGLVWYPAVLRISIFLVSYSHRPSLDRARYRCWISGAINYSRGFPGQWISDDMSGTQSPTALYIWREFGSFIPDMIRLSLATTVKRWTRRFSDAGADHITHWFWL